MNEKKNSSRIYPKGEVLKVGLQTPRSTDIFSGGMQVQKFFINDAKMLFVFFTLLAFALVGSAAGPQH